MRVNLYDVTDDGREILTDENVLLSLCFPGPENDEDYYHAHSILARHGVHHVGGGASPERVIRVTDAERFFAAEINAAWPEAPMQRRMQDSDFGLKVEGFEPIRPLRAPDDGSSYYVDAMASCGSPRVDYGSSELRQTRLCNHNTMVETHAWAHAWKCADCGYVYK
jgi:hypothetical protein